MKPPTPIVALAVLTLGCGVALALGLATHDLDRLLAFPPGQQGPPNAPPSTAPPSEPIEIHAPPPRPPADFEGPPTQVSPQRHFDAAKTRKDAEELAALAGKIPGEVDQVSKGMLPKDIAQQLKEIEKVAKRLRGEIAP
ncbi:MAG TPA: hypothetical protein VI455_02545 [Terriglobia bacterium]